MELVLMLPQGKPPYIGLVYPEEALAAKDSEYLMEVDENSSIALKVSLDEREPKLFILIDYKQYEYMKITTNEFYAARHFRAFENAEQVNFGPVIKRNGKFLPVWSGKHKKWLVCRVSMVVFYFRKYL